MSGEGSNDVVRERLLQVKRQLAAGDFVSARGTLKRMIPALLRANDARCRAEVHKLMGLLDEVMGDRVEAGVQYCCAMRLAESGHDDAMASAISSRLASMSRPSSLAPFVPAGGGEDVTAQVHRQVADAACARVEVMRGRCLEGLRAMLCVYDETPPGSALRGWLQDDIPVLARRLGPAELASLLPQVNDSELAAKLRESHDSSLGN